MNEELIARLSRRYLALDIHKHYSVVAGVNFEGQVVVEPVRIEHADLEGWLAKNIQPTDFVVIESTTNAWHIYDLLEPLAEKVLVANPIKVKQIAQARIKTDIRDTLILARLLAANMVPVIWVPPLHVRELRYLLSQRRHLVGMHTTTVNRMHSVAHRHHLSHPRGKRFNEKNTGWQQAEELSDSEKFQLELDMSTKKHLAEQAEKITEKLRRTPALAVRCKCEPPETVGREHDVPDAITWLWRDHGHDRSGCYRGHHSFWNSETPGKLFRLGAWPGAERREVALQENHKRGSQGLALGNGRGSTTGCEI